MDWKDTDPNTLRLPLSPQSPETFREETAQKETPPDAPCPDSSLGPLLEISFVVPADVEDAATNVQEMTGWLQAPSVTLPAASPLLPSETSQAIIWQKLSHLVHTPGRFDGLWPFLTPVSGIALFACLVAGNGWMAVTWLMVLAASLKINSLFGVKEHARDALALAPYDLRWVGPLAQAINSPHPRVQGVSAQILAHLLPHLRAEDGHLLNPQQRMYLNERLFRSRRRDSDLHLGILAAWQKIGDSEAVPYVERLAHRWAWTARQREVRKAAGECLATLETRLEEEHAALAEQERAQAGNLSEETTKARGASVATAEMRARLEKLEEERRKHSNPGMRMGFLIATWFCIVPYTAFMTWAALGMGNMGSAAIWAVLTLVATQFYRLTLSTKQTAEAKKLANTDEVHAVGPLAEALEWPDAGVKRIAADALTRLLPRMTAADGNLLNAKQRASLYHFLRRRYIRSHYQLILAILRALEQVGDQAAIPAVERLAEGHAYTKREQQVRQLARDIRPNLENSAKQQSVSSTLLRASSAHDTPSALLLRGAMATAEEAPQQLLRASASEENV